MKLRENARYTRQRKTTTDANSEPHPQVKLADTTRHAMSGKSGEAGFPRRECRVEAQVKRAREASVAIARTQSGLTDFARFPEIQILPTRNHPQTPVVYESKRSDGRVYHRCAEDERERVAGGSICIPVYFRVNGNETYMHIERTVSWQRNSIRFWSSWQQAWAAATVV